MGKRILLVEDDLAIRQLLSVIMQNESHSTVKASNGIEGLAALEANKNHIDLIISDIMMNDMDGFEFLKNVKANPNFKTIPFVFLSAKTDPQSRILGLRLGADDYITKPFNRDEVALKIRMLLEKSNNLKKTTITGLAGNLRNMSMPEVYQLISITKRSGILILVSPVLSGAMYFKNGVLINAAIGDDWGEESARKLVCLNEGDFRFEPNPLQNIKAIISKSFDELNKACPIPTAEDTEEEVHEVVETSHEPITLALDAKFKVIKNIDSSSSDLTVNEKSALQLISVNPDITAREVEQILGANARSIISILMTKGYIGRTEAAKPTLTHPPSSPPLTVAKFLDELTLYEGENDLYALHVGLLGTKENIKSFIGTFAIETEAYMENVEFNKESVLANLPNFKMIKLLLEGHVVYFHTLICYPGQQFLWDAIFNPTIGVIVLNEKSIVSDVTNFMEFSNIRRFRTVLEDMDGRAKPDISKILQVLYRVIARS